MIAIARGSITEADKLGPFVDDESVVERLKAEGLIKAVGVPTPSGFFVWL